MWFFTADEHYYHTNIIKYCNRPFSSVEEMNEVLIQNHNRVVKNGDIVVHAGDFSFANRDKTEKIIKQLNGAHIFLKGDHDKWLSSLAPQIWQKKIDNHYIVVCHYCLRVWPKSHYGSYMLYGHCLDTKTEILTENGWKTRDTIDLKDKILTLNTKSKKLEYNPINEITDYTNYNGKIYKYKSRGIDLRVTENHVLIDLSYYNNKVRKFYAKDLSRIDKRLFIKAGFLEQDPFNISDDQIRLLVWIAADGSLSNSSLWRIRVFKPRKIIRIRNLLNRLNIKYKEHPQKDGSISFNFNTPYYFTNWSLKPLSKNIINFDRRQLEILLEEYSHTDGYKNGNCILIYTSKKEEADLIQHACVINGFTCNIQERINQGFAKKPNYELVITNKTTRSHSNLKTKVKIEKVTNEHVWCVKTDNKTIMIRRNGKPIIVGNSHGNLPPIGKSWDVGVDNNQYYPISLDEIVEIMKKRPDNPNLIEKKFS
ncbi:MAG: hypothetical protein ACTSQE_16930 [Candidatus Heimdallarchaeaceae archaeon]